MKQPDMMQRKCIVEINVPHGRIIIVTFSLVSAYVKRDHSEFMTRGWGGGFLGCSALRTENVGGTKIDCLFRVWY